MRCDAQHSTGIQCCLQAGHVAPPRMTKEAAAEMCARYHRALHALRMYSHVDSGPDMKFDKTAGAKEAQDAEDAIVNALMCAPAAATFPTAEALAAKLDAMGWGTSGVHVRADAFKRDLAAALAELQRERGKS